MVKFNGSYQDLQDQVLLSGVYGEWIDRGNHKQFKAENGAVLNWWKSTRTINFQGNIRSAKALEAKLDTDKYGGAGRRIRSRK